MRYQPPSRSKNPSSSGRSAARPSTLGSDRPQVSSSVAQNTIRGSSPRSHPGSREGQQNSLPRGHPRESIASSSRGRHSFPTETTREVSQIRREPSESTSTSSDNQGPSSRLRLAWGRMKRREWHNCPSTPAHEAIMRAAIPVLRATLVTGYNSNHCSLWADANEKGALSDLMKSIWVDLGRRAGRKADCRDKNVAARLMEAEAKRVSSAQTASQ